MKKIISVFLCTLLLCTTVLVLPVSALTMAVTTIKLTGLHAPVAKTDPADYVADWQVTGNGYYIKDSYNSRSTGIYYLDESDAAQPAVNFTESYEYCYFIPLGFNSGYAVVESVNVELVDCDTPVKVEIEKNIAANIAQVYVYYNVLPPENVPKVTFDANGGDFGGAETTVITTNIDGYLTDVPQTPTQSDYAFDGWYDSKEGGTKVNVETYKFLGDTTLYAHWKEVASKIELTNVVLPMPNRTPVFATVLPDEAEYSIGLEMWYHESSGKYIYNDASKNANISGTDILGTFAAGQWYTYKVKVNEEITTDTEIYVNGVKKYFMVSGGMVCIDFLAAEPTEFTVYGEDTIRFSMGVNGSPFLFNIKDVVGGLASDATFEISGAPSWITADSAGWYLTGTYQTDSKSYEITVSVTSGSETKEFYLLIPETKANPYIAKHPQDAHISCGEKAVLQVNLAGFAPSATYKWKMEYMGSWFDASAIGYDISGADTNTLTVGSAYIAEGNRFKCEITINSLTLTSNAATVSATHSFPTSLKLIVDGAESAEKHSSKCSVCNHSFEVPHTKKWTYSHLPNDSFPGYKYWTCKDCGYESSSETFNTPTASDQVICHFYDNYSGNGATGKMVYLNSYIDFPVHNPMRDGYVFMGWAFSPDAEIPDYVNGEKVFIGENNTEFYAVWGQPSVAVGGMAVTEANKADIADCGATYDSETATLTLNDAYITTEDVASLMNAVGIYAKDYLEIKLIGENYVSCNKAEAFGIQVDGILKISGDGTLELSDDGIEVTFDSAIKADKVYFDGGFTYAKDCRNAVDADAYFMGGICESFMGLYANPADYWAYTGDIDWAPESACYAAASTSYYGLATQTSPINLDKYEPYILMASFEGAPQLHYNRDRDTVIMYGGFEDVRVMIAEYKTGGKLLELTVKKNAPILTEMEAKYTIGGNPETAAVQFFVWKQGNLMQPAVKPLTIGSIE